MVQSVELYEPKPRIHVVTFFSLKRFPQTLAFMGLNMKIYKFARLQPGYYAGGIRGKWWNKQFYTYTVGEDRDDMLAFVNSEPHKKAIHRIMEFAGTGSCFSEFVSDSPPDWEVAETQLLKPTKYFVPSGIGDRRYR